MTKFYSNDQQEKSFVQCVLRDSMLEDAVEWIGDNLDATKVFSMDELREWATDSGLVTLGWVDENTDPEDVFQAKESQKLHDWALAHGYHKDEEW